MNVRNNKNLRSNNTFGVHSKAKYFVSPASENDLRKIVQLDEYQSNKSFVLGGGSNVLFVDDFDGIVINNEIKGMFMKEITGDYVVMEVGAGEVWNDFVEICVKNNYFGLENLAKIPGKVGAAAVQNIGAYGVEQNEYFHGLSAYHIENDEFIELEPEDCKFGYRDSIFKHELKNKVIITKIRYKLNKTFRPITRYKEIKNELDKFSFVKPDGQFMYDLITRVRSVKLPDPEKIGNAGSFFKNPVISNEQFEKLQNKFPDVKSFDQAHGQKIAAGWLIEKFGWKGKRDGDVGVSDKHALIIVNYGNASGRDIYEFSEKIIADVAEKTSIKLEREVVVVG